MKKINWDEFKNKDNKIAVHCKTEEEAKDFCRQMHEHGMKWCTGNSYMEKTNYKKVQRRNVLCRIRNVLIISVLQ